MSLPEFNLRPAQTLVLLLIGLWATTIVLAADERSGGSTREVSLTGTVDLNSLLEPLRETNRLPALAAAVVRRAKMIGVGAIGLRRAGRSARVTVRDKFHIGSCTKSMTAALAAMLVEEKR